MNKKLVPLFIIVLAVTSLGVSWAYRNNNNSRSKPVEIVKSVEQPSKDLEQIDPEDVLSSKSLDHYEQFAEDIKQANIKNSSTISIQFFGDIMLDRNVAKNMGTKGLDYLFQNIAGESKGLYHHADLLVANLEGAFATTRVPTTKSIAFRFDPKLAAQLKRYQFDVVSLANNHSLDMGWKNVDFTEKTLAENGVGYFGTQTKEGKDLTWIAEIPGKQDKVAFVGLNNTDHALNMPQVYEAIKDAQEKARYVIVFMHWGVEYKRISREQERTLARTLLDKGASAVIGAHPHVIQEMELYKGKPIFYSLGNFVFDQYFSEETQEGISTGLILQDGVVKQISIFPFYGVKSQLQLMEGDRQAKFFEWWNKNSRIDGKKFENGKLKI